MLTKSALAKVVAELESTPLTSAGFSVATGEFGGEESAGGAELQVVYLDNPEFRFCASHHDSSAQPWRIELSPGIDRVEAETIWEEELRYLLRQLREWAGRIVAEITPPSPSPTDTLRAFAESWLRGDEAGNAPFSPAELERFHGQVESLRADIAAEQERAGAFRDTIEADMKSVRAEIAELRSSAGGLPRRAHKRAVLAKVLGYIDTKVDLALRTGIEATIKESFRLTTGK